VGVVQRLLLAFWIGFIDLVDEHHIQVPFDEVGLLLIELGGFPTSKSPEASSKIQQIS
jgi:hypothetical protein